MKYATLIAVVLTTASLTATAAPSSNIDRSIFIQTAQAAKFALDRAVAMGGNWCGGAELLQKAHQAARSDNLVYAQDLAELAQWQGALCYEQVTSN